MKTWKREKEKGRERNWKKESSRKGKGGFIVKERKHGIQSLTGGEVWALEKGTVVFSCYYFALCCKLFQV